MRVGNRAWLRPGLDVVSILYDFLLLVKVDRGPGLEHDLLLHLLIHPLLLHLLIHPLLIHLFIHLLIHHLFLFMSLREIFFFNDMVVLLLLLLIAVELGTKTELRFKVEWIQEFRKEIVELDIEIFLLVNRVRVMNIRDTAEEVDELRIRQMRHSIFVAHGVNDRHE